MGKRDAPSPNENKLPAPVLNDDETSATSAKRQRTTEERIAVAGRVASVRLQNFMCHANLQIDFKTKENNCFYIGGPNGSGKSALFAAINLGLGGRGSDNDRGNTVKSYIKDGTPQAKITITLTNEGLNSHPDLGQLISIERTINQSSSTYVMKSIKISSSNSQSETVISKKKSDIDRIVSRFNIHLSNPAFWMSQDRSRSFLANFKPSNVYKLYLESTNLENIQKAYIRFAGAIEECFEIVERKAAEVAIENRKLKRMQEQRELQEKLESDRTAISVIHWKLLFCKVRDFEAEISINSQKQKVHKKLFQECRDEYSANRAARNVVQKNIQDIVDEVGIQKEDLDEATDQRTDKSRAVMMLEDQIAAFESQIRRKQNDMKMVTRAIEDTNSKYRILLAKQGNVKLAEKMDALENDHRRISQEREEMELGGDLDKLKDRAELAQSEAKKKDDEKYNTQRQIRRLQEQSRERQDTLRRAKAAKTDSVNKFGNNMVEILTEIKRNKSLFSREPIGPIGKFVTLTDPKWAYAVEDCMFKIANNFLCGSQEDANALRGVFNRVRLPPHDRPSIIVTDLTGVPHPHLKEPSNEFKTMFRVLKISDIDVQNVLIDKLNFEQFILVEDKTEAMRLMGSDNPPHNASRAYTVDASQAYANGPSSQYRFYAGRPGRPTGLFGNAQTNVDESSLIRELDDIKTECAELEVKARDNDTELRELQKEQYNAKKAIDDFEKKLSNLRSQEVRIQRTMEDMKSEMAQVSSEDQLASLTDAIEDMQNNKIPEIENELQNIQQQLMEAKKQLKPAEAAKKQAERDLDDIKKEINDLHVRSKTLQTDLASFDNDGEVFKARLDKLKADEGLLFHDEARLKTERDEAQVQLENNKKTTQMPEGQSDPPDLTDFPVTNVAEKKLAQLQNAVDRAAVGCDHSITLDAVKDFKETLKKSRYFCRQVESALDTLRDVHVARCKAYPSLKKYTELKVCDKFQELLEVRGHFLGGLEFDHDKQTLNVNVQSCKEKDAMAEKRQNANEEEQDDEEEGESDYVSDDSAAPRRKKAKKQPKKKKARDLKGLSGGERSFVTAALVMSLWEVMEQPFRMLDEFDVFMDMMNRKLVMDLLVELATKKFPHNQFIFFTPQGIKELKLVDGLQVFEMNKVRD